MTLCPKCKSPTLMVGLARNKKAGVAERVYQCQYRPCGNEFTQATKIKEPVK